MTTPEHSVNHDYRGRSVFISQDFMLVDVFNDIQQRLEARGIEVVRGPGSVPGQRVNFPRESWPKYFGRAEVAMFSSRNVATREIMQFAPRLRGIVNPTIGLDTVDLQAAAELGIIVGHGATPENFNGIAEATVLLMLMLMYNPDATREVMHGKRPRPAPTPESAWARLMMRRTVGLVGFGRIARGVAERLQGWQMRILAYDPYIPPESVPAHVQLVDYDTLLRESDLVSVLVAVTPESRGIISERALSLMKPTAFLINTARGDAVDEAALIRALQQKRIAGAALDNFQVEPLPADSPLWQLDNVILTPHMIGHTKDVFASFGKAGEDNILAILRGEAPPICKNPEVMPAFQARLQRLAQTDDCAR